MRGCACPRNFSKMVETLNDYNGGSDFFEIAYAEPENATTWSVAGQLDMTFTIPKKKNTARQISASHGAVPRVPESMVRASAL